MLWHCPDNIKRLATEFKEIPQFCFPGRTTVYIISCWNNNFHASTDLHRLPLEKAQDGTGDFIVFTLANSNNEGKEPNEKAEQFYGICYRYLFRGNGRRFDAGRRHRHCLCIVSRYPHFSLFRTLLMNIYAIALLEEKPSQCKKYVEALFGQLYYIYHSNRRVFQTLEPSLLTDTSTLPSFRWTVPTNESSTLRDFNILPLFDTLGIEKFFNLLSAVLTEKRILLVADAINTLSSAILGLLAAIHPFQWSHLLITTLPLQFISYISTHTSPYLIGIQRSIFSTMRKDILQGRKQNEY